jgi:F0F1-type ATP synthase assembly protein I
VLSQIAFVVGRIASKPVVHATAAVASLPVAAAGMHAVGFTADPDMTGLAKGMLDGAFWLALGMAALFGGLGGVVAELLSLRGHIELPHRVRRPRTARRSRLGNPRFELDLGIVSRVLLGAAAGLALLAIYAPTSPTGLVVNALIAGSAGTGVFRLVQGRLLAGQGSAARPQGSGVKSERAATKAQLSVVPEAHSSVA